MRKTILIAMLAGFAVAANAITVNAPSSLIGSSVLNGSYAYSWGIAIAVPAGQTISSAQIDFSNIKLTAANSSGTGYLYTDLLNSQHTGVTSAADYDAAGDYWATQFSGGNIAQLGKQFFASVGTTLSWTYVLNASQLTTLNSYLASGSFSIGIDPDCHYTVGGLSFTYTLSNTNNSRVPDMASTAFLLALSLGGLEIIRRQLNAAKAKA